MSPLKIGVIGTGLIGRKHIEVIQKSDQFQLAAIANPSSDSSDLVNNYNVAHFEAHGPMLAHQDLDCVIIATSNETHEAIAADCLDKGLSALLEKPATHTVEAGLRLEKQASQSNAAKILVGHHRRHNPVLGKVKSLVQDAPLGPLIGFSGIWSVFKPDPYYDVAWRVGASGGPIFINLIHEIDNLQSMFGPVRSVTALPAQKYRDHGTIESCAVTVEMMSGVIGTVLISDSAASPWSWERATGENAALFRPIDENPYRLVFQKGGLEFPLLKIWHQEQPNWTGDFETSAEDWSLAREVDVFDAQLAHFADVVRGIAAPLVSLRDGVKALQIAQSVTNLIAEGGGYSRIEALPWEE